MKNLLPAALMLALAPALRAQDAWRPYDGPASGMGVGGTVDASRTPVVRFGADGAPIAAWREDAGGGAIYLRRWDGWTWAELAGSATAQGLSGTATDPIDPELAIDGRS